MSQDDVYVTARRFCGNHDEIRLGREEGHVVTQRDVADLLEQDRQDTLETLARLLGRDVTQFLGAHVSLCHGRVAGFVADGKVLKALVVDSGGEQRVPVRTLLEELDGWEVIQ